jgi:hypothetical protein
MGRNQRKRKQRRINERAGRAVDDGIIAVTVGLDGVPFALDDDCPICRQLRDSGLPQYTWSADGQLIPLDDGGAT